ncbi:MAG: alpha/beta hydrolase [Roseiflexaceae bacterium]|nr:alpha/beta hydrolase [Roseiflexaceae bacterium]
MLSIYHQFLAAYPLQAATVDGARWEYIRCGRGSETLLLLPGGFGAADTSFRYMLALKDDFSLISVSYPPNLASAAQLVDGLIELLGKLGIMWAHVLGGSASGLVAQLLARRRPDLIGALILSHTSAPQPGRAPLADGAASLFRALPLPLLRGCLRLLNRTFLPGSSPETRFWRGYFAQMIDTLPRAAYVNRMRWLAEIDRTGEWFPDSLPHPILLIEAEHDAIVGARARAALARLYPQARRVTLPAGAHADTVTQPEAEIAIIRAFLRDVRADAA